MLVPLTSLRLVILFFSTAFPSSLSMKPTWNVAVGASQQSPIAHRFGQLRRIAVDEDYLLACKVGINRGTTVSRMFLQ